MYQQAIEELTVKTPTTIHVYVGGKEDPFVKELKTEGRILILDKALSGPSSNGKMVAVNNQQSLIEILQQMFTAGDVITFTSFIEDLETISTLKEVAKYLRLLELEDLADRAHGPKWVRNGLKNLSTFKHCKDFFELNNKFEGRTALICGRGPSLQGNIEVIKANRSELLVLCAATAANTLLIKGIDPDFIFQIDPSVEGISFDTHRYQIIPWVVQPSVEPELLKFLHRERYLQLAVNCMMSSWLENSLIQKPSLIWNGGTVTFTMATSALAMGCDKLILLGCELSYKNMDEVPEYKRRDGLFKIRGQQNECVTTPDFASYVTSFESLANDIGPKGLFNASTGGAYIEGWVNLPLEECIASMDLVETSLKPFDGSGVCVDLSRMNWGGMQEGATHRIKEAQAKNDALLKAFNGYHKDSSKIGKLFDQVQVYLNDPTFLLRYPLVCWIKRMNQALGYGDYVKHSDKVLEAIQILAGEFKRIASLTLE
jgi:hypothetical protein